MSFVSTGSGRNDGSSVSRANAACISAVRRPSCLTQLMALARAAASRDRRSSTHDQPSPSFAMKVCKIERVTSSACEPAPSSSVQPSNGGIAAKLAISVRKRLTSSSGWTPVSSLRRTFRIARSSMRIEVFDCSALLQRRSQSPPGSSPTRGSCRVRPMPSRPAKGSSPPVRSSISIQARAKASTEKASTIRVAPPRSAVPGGTAITCAGSAASTGTSASGTNRRNGSSPGGVTCHKATAAGTPTTGKGSRVVSSTAGRPASLAGYQRWPSRNSGSLAAASAFSSGNQTSGDRAKLAPGGGGEGM